MQLRQILAVALVLCACGTDINNDNGGGQGGSSAGGGTSDLPCDVQSMLAAHCTSCHGSPPAGAPMPLVSYADLIAPGLGGVTIADRALARMTSTTSPMPPAPAARVSAAELATFQSWVTGGMPMGSCGADPLNAAPTCTSGSYWAFGNAESALMHPGAACVACHQSSFEAPRFTVAGTLYPTGHEPTDCNGTTAATIVITDANGTVVSLTPNTAGNFYSSAALAFPIHATVVVNGTERAMVGAQQSGDCNACHTQTGASMAPGRVAVPPP